MTKKYPKLLQIYETNELILVCKQTWGYVNYINYTCAISIGEELPTQFRYWSTYKNLLYTFSNNYELISIYDIQFFTNKKLYIESMPLTRIEIFDNIKYWSLDSSNVE